MIIYNLKYLKYFDSPLPISANAWVHVVMETTKDGTDEQDRLTRLPSANKTIRFPFGHIIWST